MQAEGRKEQEARARYFSLFPSGNHVFVCVVAFVCGCLFLCASVVRVLIFLGHFPGKKDSHIILVDFDLTLFRLDHIESV